MLISHHEDAPNHQANTTDPLATCSEYGWAGSDSDWVDPAGSTPAPGEQDNTLGGWL